MNAVLGIDQKLSTLGALMVEVEMFARVVGALEVIAAALCFMAFIHFLNFVVQAIK